MKERPILMSAPMVNALLEGRKTQTRRIVKHNLTQLGDGHFYAFDHRGINYRVNTRTTTVRAWANLLQFCPYGQPGDRLWVKETFGITESAPYADGQVDEVAIYRADGWNDDTGHFKWKPSIFMPRKFSRILLEITEVRVERLQDISEADAKAEGIEPELEGWIDYRNPSCQMCVNPVGSYRTLWESINGSGSWNKNPWVWVISFKKVNHEE
jgi:hypothetical protein